MRCSGVVLQARSAVQRRSCDWAIRLPPPLSRPPANIPFPFQSQTMIKSQQRKCLVGHVVGERRDLEFPPRFLYLSTFLHLRFPPLSVSSKSSWMEGGGEHKKEEVLSIQANWVMGGRRRRRTFPLLFFGRNIVMQSDLSLSLSPFLSTHVPLCFFEAWSPGVLDILFSCLMIYIDIAVKATEIQSKIRLTNYCIHYPVLV